MGSENLLLRIEGIRSEDDRLEVKKVLEDINGVSWVCVDGTAGTAVVIFDPELTPQDELINAVMEAGYTVKRFFNS
ncbi:heavy-metal-associated domain-containing protein [Desulfofundulus sp.]|uniref:heavy-metal-associated domain-containing protein n=1 Tax=Desulfofundulus sp. TaxID=2282750 RepID=UPI003C718F39